MKVGFVLYDYYPFGGLQEDCLATALQTAARGHEVHIFTRTWKGEQPEALHVHLLGKKGWSNLSRNERFFRDLAQALPESRLDGVVAFNRIPDADIYFAADPCYLERSKRFPLWKRLGVRHRYYSRLERGIFGSRRPPHTLVLTEREIESFRRYYATPLKCFHLLPPGVARNTESKDTMHANRQAVRSELGTDPEAKVALFVGSGFRIKGLDRALRAIRATEQTTAPLEFWVVGKGKASHFQRLLNRIQAPVRFLGGRSDVSRFYDAADCLLHPAYSESAGKVLLEALTHGLPVITTETCGYAPYIADAEAGTVIQSPYSQETLNNTLACFLKNSSRRERMRENALRYAASQDLYSCHETAAAKIESILS